MTYLTEGDTIAAPKGVRFHKATHPYASKLRMPTLGTYVTYDGHYWARRGAYVNGPMDTSVDPPVPTQLYLIEEFHSKDGDHRAVAGSTFEEALEAANSGQWSPVVVSNQR